MQNLYQTGTLLRIILRRDWLKLIVWLIAAVGYVLSGVGKFSTIFEAHGVTSPIRQATTFHLFNNPAMVSLFGSTAVTNPAKYTIGAAFAQTMVLLTAVIFSVVAVIYVINHTRKEEDDGVVELFGSYPLGRLAQITAIVIELCIVQFTITIVLGLMLHMTDVESLKGLNSNLLYGATIGSQGLLWGMVALVAGQLFSDAGSAKAWTFGGMGLAYVLRMFTDTNNADFSWLSPWGWSYLAQPYVDDNWWPVILALAVSVLLLIIAYWLNQHRDLGAGYFTFNIGSEHTNGYLNYWGGFVLRQQFASWLGWLLGLSILGAVYGSMFDQIGDFLKHNHDLAHIMGIMNSHMLVKQMQAQYLAMLLIIITLLITCYAVANLMRLVREERKGRFEQLYSLPLGRGRVYLTYVAQTIVLSGLVQLCALLTLWGTQAGNRNALIFTAVMKPGLAYLAAVWCVVGILCLFIAFAPRLQGVIWVYIGFAFLLSYLGNIVTIDQKIKNLNIFGHVMKRVAGTVTANTPDWPTIWLMLGSTVILIVLGMIGYRQRDLITG